MTARQGHDVVHLNNMLTPYSDRLFAALAADGLDLAVVSCTRQEPNRHWANAIVPRYPHEILRGWTIPVGPRRFAHINRGVSRALGRLSPRRLVVTGLYPTMLIAAAWARRSRIPIVYHVDGGRADMPMSAYHRVARRWMFGIASAGIVCGRKGAAFFADQGMPGERIVTMPIVPAWPAPARIPARDERAWDLLWVAELSDTVKNVSFFRDVVLALHQTMPGLSVRIVGQGRDEEALLAPLNAAGVRLQHDRVVPPAEMAAIFQDARMLLLPSHREPWGLVCHEAMQCGTPAIVSPHVGAADDMVQDGVNGYVVRLDTDAWVSRIVDLLSDAPSWARLSDAAVREAASRNIDVAVAAFRRAVAMPPREEG